MTVWWTRSEQPGQSDKHVKTTLACLPAALLPSRTTTKKKTDTKIPGAPAPAPHQHPTLQPARKRTRAHTETTEDLLESEARRSEPPRKKTDIKNPDAPT